MPFLHLKGVHVPHHKDTASMPAVLMPTPATVTIPTVMHIGKPAVPTVKVGDKVAVGQLIASADGFVSSPIHSSISGTVKKIEDTLLSNGTMAPAIVIESDGEMRVSEEVKPPLINSYDDFIAAVKNSGIVGLGGAGFPTFIKLGIGDLSRLEDIIVNGAECEPYITSDTRTMIDDIELVHEGVKILKQYLGAKKIIFGVEANKPECIKSLKAIADKDDAVSVISLPSVYPQGGEKVLVYHLTGKTIPEGKLPIDVGSIVINCTTLACIAEYVLTGMPLVRKKMTVAGSAVAEPKNIIAPIGTSLKDVFDFCGGFSSEPGKVLYGGPMMGLAVPSLDVPVLKNTNAVLAFNKKDSAVPDETACIHCGNCVEHCPMNLNPPAVAKAYELKNPEELERLKINLCIECGCCTFQCPARRRIVQRNKLAKNMLREYQTKKKEAGK